MLAASLPHPRVEDVFVGRSVEREKLADAVFATNGTRRPVVVSGMAGVGKSYLVDRFFWENMARLPGGYLRLAVDPDKPASGSNLLAALRDRLKLPMGDDEALAARLLMPLSVVHIENADTIEAGQVVGDLAASLPGCALVVTARLRGLGADAGWREVAVAPFDTATALEQLRAELGPEAPGQESWPALAAALGCLPLALHLAAGHMRVGHRAEAFLRRLRAKNLALTGADPADPTFRARSRALLSNTFELSLDALRREGGEDGEQWLAAFSALGHAPVTGFGESLGAAISGLVPDGFVDLALAAARLSLLDHVPRGAGSAFRLHPLLAELVRSRATRDVVIARITEWFVARLPEGGEDQGRRWRERHEELAALTEWLARVPPADRARVERGGGIYSILNGPYDAWLSFCEEALKDEISDEERSELLWMLGNAAWRGGHPDRALAAAEEKRSLDLKRSSAQGAALATGLIADILAARGNLNEAIRIRQEEELPVYEHLGEVRLVAITKGKIADIMQARGDFDGAMRIRCGEELPVFQALGDMRLAAVTNGKIADIMQAHGSLDEALRIRQEEQLPVFERLGDVHQSAVTKGKIADIIQARGDFDGALRIRREEVLPVFERLGDVRSAAVTKGEIADIMQKRGEFDGALRIVREEELPVYERLGDVRALLVGRTNLALMLLRQGSEGEERRLDASYRWR
jgi:tetratricopeptide (TPR) repeat protein